MKYIVTPNGKFIGRQKAWALNDPPPPEPIANLIYQHLPEVKASLNENKVVCQTGNLSTSMRYLAVKLDVYTTNINKQKYGCAGFFMTPPGKIIKDIFMGTQLFNVPLQTAAFALVNAKQSGQTDPDDTSCALEWNTIQVGSDGAYEANNSYTVRSEYIKFTSYPTFKMIFDLQTRAFKGYINGHEVLTATYKESFNPLNVTIDATFINGASYDYQNTSVKNVKFYECSTFEAALGV